MDEKLEEALHALLGGMVKRQINERGRREEILDTIVTHHGVAFGIAAVSVVDTYRATLKALSLVKIAGSLPEPLYQVFTSIATNNADDVAATLLYLAAKCEHPNGDLDELVEDSKGVKALIEPLIDDAFRTDRQNKEASQEVAKLIMDQQNKED